jgi:hypothetical protein
VLTTGFIQMSLMEQKEEQPMMTLPLSPSSIPWTLHPVSR